MLYIVFAMNLIISHNALISVVKKCVNASFIFLYYMVNATGMKQVKNLKRIRVRNGLCRESAYGLKNSYNNFNTVDNPFWSGRPKNYRSHIKLILCCFCPIISPHTKFHQNRMKNRKVTAFSSSLRLRNEICLK